MPDTVKSKAELKLDEMRKRAKRAMKEADEAQQARRDLMAKLRAERLAKEDADAEAARNAPPVSKPARKKSSAAAKVVTSEADGGPNLPQAHRRIT